MRIVARRTLDQFVASVAGQMDHLSVKKAIDTWFFEVKKAEWTNSADIRNTFATASITSAERVVFNIRGNSYRLVATVNFRLQTVWIKWIGTHRDYDKIDVKEIQYGQ